MKILDAAATAPFEGGAVNLQNTRKAGSGGVTLQAYGATTAGEGAAAIAVEVSDDGVNWLTLETFSLTLSTAVATAGYEMSGPWTYVRGNVTSISGTGAAVSMHLGV